MPTQIGPKDIAESRLVRFDFTKELGTGENILSATVTAAVVSGNDSSPAAILSGAPVISSPSVTQRIIGGLSNVSYHLRCVAVTDSDNTITVAGTLPVVTL